MGAQGVFNIDSGNEWSTPPWVVRQVSKRIGREFDLDPAATARNAKAPFFFEREDDGTQHNWFGYVWLNPPFSRSEKVCKRRCQRKRCAKRGFHLKEPIHGALDFALKVVEECKAGRVEIIAWHGPASTDTAWYKLLWPWIHERIDYSKRIRYNGGRHGGDIPLPDSHHQTREAEDRIRPDHSSQRGR